MTASRWKSDKRGVSSAMRSLLLITVASVSMIGCFAAPSLAQHMNVPGNPCEKAATNVKTGECFEQAYKAADKQLNLLYERISSVLNEADQGRLEAAEAAWLKYRDASCSAERDLYGMGTGANPAALACLEAETRSRTLDLHQAYGWKLQQAGL